MTQEQKAQIAKVLAVRAEIVGKAISTAAIVQMVEDVSDLEFECVSVVLRHWGRTEKGFPYPSEIREKVMPEINSEDDAIDVANLVIAAVGRYGYTNPERARAYVGELAWVTVTRMGGWKHLCEVLHRDNEGMYRAQIRSYAETVIRKSIRGELHLAPELPRPTSVESAQAENIKNVISIAATRMKHDD